VPETLAEQEPEPDWPSEDLADREQAEAEAPEWLQSSAEALPEQHESVSETLAEQEPEPKRPSEDLADSEQGEAEAPEWLQNLAEALPEQPESVPETLTEEEPEPEWPSEDLADSEQAEAEAPEWLQRLAEGLAEQSANGPQTLSEEEPGPDWQSEDLADSEQAEAEVVVDRLSEHQAAKIEDSKPVPPPIPESEERATPDWLAELRPEAVEEHPDTTAPPSPETEGAAMPDWLAELRPGAIDETQETPTLATDVEDIVVPDWLTDLRPKTEEEEREEPESLEQPSGTEEQVLPDWLTEVEPSSVARPEIDSLSPSVEVGAAADWLPESGFDAETKEPTDQTPPDPGLEKDTTEAREESPLPDKEILSERVAPDWLVDAQAAIADESPPPAAGPEADTESPDWLVPTEPDAKEEPLARAEIPAWLLALKPSELEEAQGEGRAARAFASPGEETGLLAGLQGTLPVEMVIAQPRTVRAEKAYQSLTADSPHAQIFADVVARTPDTALEETKPTAAKALGRIPRWLIYSSLIVAVMVPLLLGRPLVSRTADPPPAMIADLHGVIEALDDSASVLVAFDYDPSASDEMNLLADALIGHLMDRGATLVAVSLLPAGPATAQSVLDKQADDRPVYAEGRGERYINLGYLPGQAAGVRLLSLSLETALLRSYDGTPVAELAVLEDLGNLQDFALILELAATQDTLRWWIEQASTPSQIPLAAGVSASVAPLARPYYMTEPRQVVGLLGGVPAAAAYEALRSGQEGLADASAARLDAQLGGHLVFMLVLVIGNVAYLLRKRGGR
jgi:hypothetical protein